MTQGVNTIELILGCNFLQTKIFEADGRLPGADTGEQDLANVRAAADALSEGISLWLKERGW